MTYSELKQQQYLSDQFGIHKLWDTVDYYTALKEKNNSDPMGKADFIALIYILFTSFNVDLGQVDDRLHAYENAKEIAQGLSMIFTGRLEGEKIIFDLSNGDVYIYALKKGKQLFLDFHVSNNLNISDVEAISIATPEFLKHACEIYKKL